MTKSSLIGRRIALCLVFAVAVLVLPASASATPTIFYVSPTGSDGGPGTASQPFQTIGKAATVARRGDTVLVEPGRYAETVALGGTDSGVTFEAAASARPVLDGGGVRQYGFKNNGADDLTIKNFEITGQTDSGIYSVGSSDTFAGNIIHHVGSPAVVHSDGIRVVQRADNRVIDNTIYSIGPGGESMGIWLLQTRDALVDGNEVYLVRKEGIRDWQGLDNTITRNRFFLNWVGIAFNMSTGTTATNNYIYDNVEGLDAKHTSYPTVLSLWGLASPHWSRFWHNTVYDSTETSVWIAQSDQPLDYLDVEDNIFDDAGTALVRDAPSIRGPHVIVDGNAYVYPGAAGRPAWVYKADWTSDPPGLTNWSTYRSQLGWEAHGILVPSLALLAPASGDLDYSDDSPLATGSVDLSDSLGRQLGARGLPPATVRWTSYPMTPIDSSSKGTWSTENHLADTVDNNQNSYWMTSTASDEYVTYDFGQSRTFDHLILTLYSHMDPRNPHGYRFEVSDDLVNWRTVLSGDNPDTEGSSYKYELPAPVTARYLRFTMVDTSCDSYNPRTNCGASFVMSDLSAGLLTAASDPPLSSDPGSGSSPDPSAPAPKMPRGVKTMTPLPMARVASATLTRNGRLELSLRCPPDPAGRHCRSTALVRLPRGRHTSTRVIARRAFNVPAGRRQLLKLRLTHANVRRLRSRRAKSVRVTIRLSGRSSVSRVVHLRQERQRRRPRHR